MSLLVFPAVSFPAAWIPQRHLSVDELTNAPAPRPSQGCEDFSPGNTLSHPEWWWKMCLNLDFLLHQQQVWGFSTSKSLPVCLQSYQQLTKSIQLPSVECVSLMLHLLIFFIAIVVHHCETVKPTNVILQTPWRLVNIVVLLILCVTVSLFSVVITWDYPKFTDDSAKIYLHFNLNVAEDLQGSNCRTFFFF